MWAIRYGTGMERWGSYGEATKTKGKTGKHELQLTNRWVPVTHLNRYCDACDLELNTLMRS